MAKVSLRAYNREIEAMIDRGHLDEAIAHCQHILKTFPKHLESYRLLGKSYLEAKRHNEAVDIFSRVLVAEPSDFVAQVGMSIIRDEQGKFDDAIWHMERAFETQPSNAAIQGELQRLYGRRDGVQPPRIRMTRGALAHMYMQGELYPQAISETKGVLGEDQGRTDMQALLAKAYFKSGQKNDAADAASTALKRYPYCLDANRVLTEILGSDRPESAEVYRRRVFELDPYAAQVNGSVFESREVNDAAITLEQLDWNGQPVGMSSDWGSTGGISLKEGEQPDWLKNAAPLEEASTPPSSPAFISEQETASTPETDSPAEPAEDIPDFLKQAGWGESTGAFDESKSSAMFDDEPASEAQPIEQGDMPDWVKAMAPAETPASESADDEEIPDWINKIGTGDLPVPAADSSTDDQPDWLSQTSEDTSADSSEPDLLGQLGGESEVDSSSQPIDDADFLNSLNNDEPEAPVASSEERTAMPDEKGNLGMGEDEQDDAFAWLENLAAKQGASEGLLTTPEERLEDEPDWIKQAKDSDESESQPQPSTDEQEPEDVLPVEPVEEAPVESVAPALDAVSVEELGKSDEERDDSFNWLENLAAKQGATEGLLTKPEERREDEPDWVKQAKDSADAQPPAQPSAESVPTTETDDDMDWMKNAKDVGEKFFDDSMGATEQDVEPTTEQIDIPVEAEITDAAPASTDDDNAWLKTLEEPEPTPTATSSGDDDMMAWMEQEDAPAAEPAVPEKKAVEASDDLPGWLNSLDEDESKPAVVPESDDLPTWMTDDTGELVAEPTKIEPTRSTDWTSEEQKETKAMVEETPSPEPVADARQSTPEPKPEPVAEVEKPTPAPEPEKKPEPKKKEVKPATPPEPYKEPVTRKTTGMLEMPVDPILGSARAELTRSNIPGALETYGKLIKKGRFLEEVIYDLRDALYRYPVEVSIWQSLGDAYMRANQLQDALDSYTKAEELLR